MAVQQNKKSTARRGNRRAHDFLSNPALAVEPTTGEVTRRHHISPNGFYRGKKVIETQKDEEYFIFFGEAGSAGMDLRPDAALTAWAPRPMRSNKPVA